jgi:hypothetical protein
VTHLTSKKAGDGVVIRGKYKATKNVVPQRLMYAGIATVDRPASSKSPNAQLGYCKC